MEARRTLLLEGAGALLGIMAAGALIVCVSCGLLREPVLRLLL